jgi:hypothetical protein
MQNFIRVGVADAAQQSWISECSLERVIFSSEHAAKRIEIGREDVDSSRIESTQALLAADHVQRGSPFRARLGQNQRTVGKIERRQTLSTGEHGVGRAPVQPTGNHQMQYQPEIIFQANRDPFADAPQLLHGLALGTGERWLHSSQQEWAGQAHVLQLLAGDARLESGYVSRDVRQFRHRHQL